jgi:hypothetical protein
MDANTPSSARRTSATFVPIAPFRIRSRSTASEKPMKPTNQVIDWTITAVSALDTCARSRLASR